MAEVLGRPAHQGRQEALDLLGQDGRAAAPVLVGEHRRVRLAGEGGRPIVDALPGHAEHGGDVGGGPPPVEFRHGQGPPVGEGVGSGFEPLTETTALPVLSISPLISLSSGDRREMGKQNFN
jgi:hypothetical protein